MNKELQGYLIGNATIMLWVASLIFAVTASAMMFIYRIQKRNVESSRTPVAFSWSFFLKDTGLRMITTFGFILLLIRAVFVWNLKDGWVVLIAIGIGLISDRLGAIFTRASDKSVELINDKVDQVIDKLKHQETEVKTVKDDVSEIKTDVKDIKNN